MALFAALRVRVIVCCTEHESSDKFELMSQIKKGRLCNCKGAGIVYFVLFCER